MIKNIIYFSYFVLKTNYTDLRKSLHCTKKKGHSFFKLVFDMCGCTLRYGTSFVDYFNFKFYEKTAKDRKEYASMGVMYKFHNMLNDKAYIEEVDNKELFNKNFLEFSNKIFVFSKSQSGEVLEFLKSKKDKKIVVKNPNSTAGRGVKIYTIIESNNSFFIDNLKIEDFCSNHFMENDSIYFEDFIVQHNAINNISPSAVNTLRIISIVDDNGKPEIIGSVFRISVNCSIDNYSVGNLAAEIDLNTGKVITGGIIKRASCDNYHDTHPITNQPILGFQIPFWDETIAMVKKAAWVVPQVRTIGWDVAITENGPVLIEGNSKWNKDTWQIPAGKGKLNIIKKYLN